MQREKDTTIVNLQLRITEPEQLDMFLHYIPSADPYTFTAPEPANDNEKPK